MHIGTVCTHQFIQRTAWAARTTIVAILPTFLLLATPLRAESPGFGSATNLRQDAQRNVPLSRLSTSSRSQASKILNDVTIFRRLPSQTIECDPEMYNFLVDHPDLVINIWEVLGITKVSLKRVGPNSFRLDDGHGTTGELHYLYRSPSQHVFYAEGTYSGSLFARPVRGRVLLSLRSAAVRDADDRNVMQCRLDSFVQIDNVGAEMFAKTFQGVLGGIADHNFREIANFVASVSQAAEASSDNIDRIAVKLDRIDAPTRRQFSDIGKRVAARSVETSASVAARSVDANAPATAQRSNRVPK